MEYWKNLKLDDIIYTTNDGVELIEKWIDVRGYEENYSVSDLGRVKSKKFKSVIRELILKQDLNKVGYLRVRVCLKGKSKTTSVHKLVANSFIGDVLEGYCVDHINNVGHDNRLINLQIITTRENTTKDKTNKLGFTGVSYKKDMDKFSSSITIEKESIHLGSFETVKEAHETYIKALHDWKNFGIKPKKIKTSSKFRGVSFVKKRGKYVVNIMINKISYYLGEYDSEEDASNIYNLHKNNYNNFGITPPEKYKNPKNKYKYKYIIYYKPYDKWLSKFKDIDGKIKHIGYFTTEDEAYEKQQEVLKKFNLKFEGYESR